MASTPERQANDKPKTARDPQGVEVSADEQAVERRITAVGGLMKRMADARSAVAPKHTQEGGELIAVALTNLLTLMEQYQVSAVVCQDVAGLAVNAVSAHSEPLASCLASALMRNSDFERAAAESLVKGLRTVSPTDARAVADALRIQVEEAEMIATGVSVGYATQQSADSGESPGDESESG